MSLTPQRIRSNTEASTTPKTLIKSGNWSKCFPTKFSTETSSCTFVKKLVTVAVSNITYLRSMFPEMAYANRSMDGLPLKILKGRNECPEAQGLANWLMGAFDALEKKYLRELMLVVYKDPANPDVVQEMYTFKFSYPEGNATCQLVQGEEGNEVKNITSDDIYKSTQNLLHTLIVLTQGLDPLPDSMMTMKLTYYDAVTPTDYEPAGFCPTTLVEPQLPPGAVILQSGKVDTSFHNVNLGVMAVTGRRGDQHGHVQPEQNAMEADHDPVQSQPLLPSHPPSSAPQPNSSLSPVSQLSCLTYTPSSVRPHNNPQTPQSEQSQTLSSVFLPSGQSKVSINCLCSNPHPDPLMLECYLCSTLQHAACYRIFTADNIPAQHCCVECSMAHGVTCTDTKLVKMSSNPAVTLTCLFRRVLSLLLQEDTVTIQLVMERLWVVEDTAEALLQKLAGEGCLVEEEGEWVVQREMFVSTVLPRYLGRQGIKMTKQDRRVEVNSTNTTMVVGGEQVGDLGAGGDKGDKKCSDVSEGHTVARVEAKKSLVSDKAVEGTSRRLSKRRKISEVKEDLNI